MLLFIISEVSFSDIFQNKHSYKFHKFNGETPVLESYFAKFAGMNPATLSKRDSKTGTSLLNLRNF